MDQRGYMTSKIEKLSHIMGPRASQDLRSPSMIMTPVSIKSGQVHIYLPPAAGESRAILISMFLSLELVICQINFLIYQLHIDKLVRIQLGGAISGLRSAARTLMWHWCFFFSFELLMFIKVLKSTKMVKP